MGRILIVEDSKDVNHMLAEVLETEGYFVKSAYTGIDGMKLAVKQKFDLIFLDIMLPYKSGDEILKEVRKVSNVPIIIISSKGMISTKVDLLKLGADDYITKPFDLREVAARVETVLRRFQRIKQVELTNKLTWGDLVLDIDSKRLTVRNETLLLTTKEFQILELLMKSPEKVLSKPHIYEVLWNEEYLGDDNAVKTHLSNLRNKIKHVCPDKEYIETVWGLGYRLYPE